MLYYIANVLDWKIYQLDVKTAYLYSVLKEEVYMEQPKGFEEPGKENWVWQLKKGLYGTKQGGHIWNNTMDVAMKKFGFMQLSSEHCIYYRTSKTGTTMATLHVDDFTAASSSTAEANWIEEEMPFC